MTSVIVRFGGYQGPASVHTRAGRELGEGLRRRLGANAVFEQIDNITAAGRNSTDLFEMVAEGELDLCYFASSYLAARVPSLTVLDLPFQVADRHHLYRCLDGELGRLLARDVAAATPYDVLAYWDNGFRHFSSVAGPIVRPADCQGLRIRTMNNALHQDVFRALGFAPRFIDVKDFPSAVKNREVDVQENPLTNTVNFKVHETHRYVSMTGHFCGAALVLANRQRFTGWPAKVQRALREALDEATAKQRGFAAAEDVQCLAALVEAGVDVKRPEEIDRQAFVDATTAIVTREAAALEPALLEALRGSA
jgi:C4-dicarboxylate-binding protein DctP